MNTYNGFKNTKKKRRTKRGKENGFCHFFEPAVFVTKVAKKNSTDLLV